MIEYCDTRVKSNSLVYIEHYQWHTQRSSCPFQTADGQNDARRSFITSVVHTSGALFVEIFTSSLSKAEQSEAVVNVDPSMFHVHDRYQETRLSAVYSLKEANRRSILQNPQLCVALILILIYAGRSRWSFIRSKKW